MTAKGFRSVRVSVDCQPPILSEVVTLALVELPGVVVIGPHAADCDLVVSSAPAGAFARAPVLRVQAGPGRLRQLLEAVRRFAAEGGTAAL